MRADMIYKRITLGVIFTSLICILLWIKLLPVHVTLALASYVMGTANPWTNVPSFEVFVRMCSAKKDIYDKILIPSMKLFWPNDTRLVVVLDNETKSDHLCGEELRNRYPYPKVFYENPSKAYNNHGHDRQQWSMFYPENYTNAEYVGFVDTDTLFVSTVTPEDLFLNGKPVVIGVYGSLLNSWWRGVALKTSKLFGKPEVMKCMGYFPVIVKVEHIVKLRHYLEKRHNKPFDDIFKEYTVVDIFSQFNIMCQYVYTFHRSEYNFRIQKRPNGNWMKESQGRMPLKFYRDNFTAKERTPITRVAIHWRYHAPQKDEVLLPPYNLKSYYPQALLEGICHSGGFDICPDHCRYFNKSNIHRNLFNFEYSDWTWDPACDRAQKKHYADVKRLIEYYRLNDMNIFGEKTADVACERIFRSVKVDISKVIH
ncbi:uncharacterized protein LOC106152497 [Lingula anatina]|uniref:Uncharacterized protein LOC106152497 n=1 Tax=Lingula anatina TaxID=7574 RepID=A0A1S3H6D8_LINAN|nr:uncharacterized protein LOC106152497 [Lingula anatina]|eukprot:XP_013381563.1 uncharacterized protein LOC106152497 [Lingula anatina]